MHNKMAVVLALFTLTMAGCGAHVGDKLVTYSSNTTALPEPITVKKAGTYALYPDDGLSPLETVHLNEGEHLGFRHGGDGHVVAFAGEKEYTLNAVLASEYVWKYQSAQ